MTADALETKHDDLQERLILLADNTELTDAQRELARTWRGRIDALRQRATAPLSLAFLAAVGRGKSSLIAAATGLRLDTPGQPKKWSVLPVGDGRTTLGELRVRFEARDDILLEVEPMAAEDLETEVSYLRRGSLGGCESGQQRGRWGQGRRWRRAVRASASVAGPRGCK